MASVKIRHSLADAEIGTENLTVIKSDLHIAVTVIGQGKELKMTIFILVFMALVVARLLAAVQISLFSVEAKNFLSRF